MELRLLEQDKLSTQKCLRICDQLSKHISQIQLTPSPRVNTLDKDLENCRESLGLIIATLKRLMKDIIDQPLGKSRSTTTSKDDSTDLTRLQEELETAYQYTETCSKADTLLKDDVSVIENYATGDAVQIMVSTDGGTIHGTNKGYGRRTRQVGGSFKDETIVQVLQDMVMCSVQGTESDGASL